VRNSKNEVKETVPGVTAQVSHQGAKWIEGPVRVWNGIVRREEKEHNAVAITALTIAVQVQVEAAVPAVSAVVA
jgi:hypothetical protein